ncbi:tail sheath stabilizer [Vibrio phage 2.275.O._10N.286.54.E11]|nr:tail sheath stabilizer [Vibrio phage 2.275.O._10N.286.54.E11]
MLEIRRIVVAKLQYFYDGQVERVIKHLIRLFGDFTVLNNYDDNGEPVYRRVPCRYGDISRQVASIIQGNSENTLKSAPFMTISITRLNMSRENIRAPLAEDVIAGTNKYDPEKGQYTNELEDIYHIRRNNPIPWDLEFSVDIWTTTLANKFELTEQIATLFNPALDVQLSTNPHDWTSKMTVENTGYTYSSRAFPQGIEYDLDIASFQFKTVMWMSLPAAVSKAKLIHQVNTNLQESTVSDGIISDIEELSLDLFAPSNHTISVYRETSDPTNVYYAKLLNMYYSETTNGLPVAMDLSNIYSWDELLKYYTSSEDAPSEVQLRLLDAVEQTPGIVGSMTIPDPVSAPNVAQIVIDPITLESTTIDPINGIIDPRKLDYNNIPGTRYVVHESIERFNLDLINNDGIEIFAEPGDIMYLDNTWKVYNTVSGDVVENTANNKRYKYLTDIGWHELISPKYATGFWRLGFNVQ